MRKINMLEFVSLDGVIKPEPPRKLVELYPCSA